MEVMIGLPLMSLSQFVDNLIVEAQKIYFTVKYYY